MRTATIASLLAIFLVPLVPFAAPKIVPKDALVLEQGVLIRQFGDNRGKVVARPSVCDELLLLEPAGYKDGYMEVLFLTGDAQEVRRGWVRPANKLYVFPEPRPVLPRADTTPGVAFPWNSKAPQPGDPDFARVTSKEFLFACLERPHPAKAAAVLTQFLDRYASELTVEEVVRLLPVLRHARDEDRGRIRDLLARFKDNPAVRDFLAANPLFGPVIEPEEKPLPEATPPPPPEEARIFGIPVKTLGFGVGGAALLLIVVALLLRRRKRGIPDEFIPPPDDPTV